MSALSSASSSSCWALRYLARFVLACCSWGHKQAGHPLVTEMFSLVPTPSPEGGWLLLVISSHQYPKQEGEGAHVPDVAPKGEAPGSLQRQLGLISCHQSCKKLFPLGQQAHCPRTKPTTRKPWPRDGVGCTTAGVSLGPRAWGSTEVGVPQASCPASGPEARTRCTHRLLVLPFVALDLALQLVHQVLHASQGLPVLLGLCTQRGLRSGPEQTTSQAAPSGGPVTHLVCEFLDPALMFPHPLEGLGMFLLFSVQLSLQLPHLQAARG